MVLGQFTEEYRPDEKYGVITKLPSLSLIEQASTPTAIVGLGRIYVKSSDGLLYFLSDSGSEYGLTNAGSSADFIGTYQITLNAGTYYATNPNTGFATSSASLDTVWTAVFAAIGSNPASVEFGAGTFVTTAGLRIETNNISVKGQGKSATVIQGDAGTGLDSTPIFRIDAVQSAAQHALTVDAIAGDLTITVSAANSANYAAGDYITLFTSQVIDTENTGRLQGEIHKILSVDTGTGIITIGQANDGTHVYETSLVANTAKIVKLLMYQNIEVTGIGFTDAATSRPSTLTTGQVYFHGVDNLTVTDCSFRDMFHDGLALWQVLNARIVDNFFQNIKDVTPTANTFYGVSIKGASINVSVMNNSFDNMRHSVTTAAGSSNANAGRVRNLVVSGNTSIASYAAHFDCHQGADNVTIIGNTMIGDDGNANGIGVRSRATIIGNAVYGVLGKGIVLSADAHSSVISGNYIRGCTVGIQVESATNDATITGNTIYKGAKGIVLARGAVATTVTIASPAVFTRVSHNYTAGTQVSFSSSGSLPTGLVAGTVYYVIADGIAKDTYRVSATKGGTAVNTSGSQSGTHTARTSGGCDSLIADNNIFDNSGNGLEADSTHRLMLTGNRFRANAQPFVMTATDGNIMTGWTIANNESSGHATSDIPTIAGTAHVIRGNVGFDSMTKNYLAVTALLTLNESHYYVDATANTFTITIPTPVAIAGREYLIKNSGSGVITVSPAAGTIDGAASIDLQQGHSIRIVSNNSNWIRIDSSGFLSIGLGAARTSGVRNQILTDATFTRATRVEGDVVGRFALSSFITADAQLRFTLGIDGKQSWGDGTNAVDTNLYREGADTLKTDDAFEAASIIVGGSTLSAAALMQADSTTKGFLPPRMTSTQRDAISTPPAGLMIYNTSTNKLNVFTTGWEAVTSL